MLDRGQMYGDGFFETMLMINGKVALIHLHHERILKTAHKLKLILPEEFLDLMKFEILLRGFNSSGHAVRIRLNIIRNGNGFYLPQHHTATYNFNVQPAVNPSNQEGQIIHLVGIAESVTIYSKGLSNYKTLAKSEQVLLSLECKERCLDDLLVLNEKGEVVECIYSNIFFIQKDGIIVTPSLESGCLDGCMRKYLIENQKIINLKIKEKSIYLSDLSTYISCFITNSVSGLKSISAINSHNFEDQEIIDINHINKLILKLFI